MGASRAEAWVECQEVKEYGRSREVGRTRLKRQAASAKMVFERIVFNMCER